MNNIVRYPEVICIAIVLLTQSSTVRGDIIVAENFGNSASVSGQSLTSYTGYQTTYSFTGNATVGTPTTGLSTGYVGASGGSRISLADIAGASTTVFTISGIDTSQFAPNSFSLSFGYRTGTMSFGGVPTPLTISASTDGTTFNNILQPSLTASTNWALYTRDNLTLPTSNTLSVRFSKPPGVVAAYSLFIDDLRLSATAVPEPNSFICVGFFAAIGILYRKRTKPCIRAASVDY